MPKHYSIKPVLRPGKTVYSANFYAASGNRVTRSLRTEDHDTAALICQGLVRLGNADVKTIDDVPAGTPPESVRLYFEVKDESELPLPSLGQAFDLANTAEVQSALQRFPADAKGEALLVLVDRYKIRHELESLQMKYTSQKNEFETLRHEYESLKRSVVARIANSAEGMPELAASIDLFEKHLATTTTADNTKIHAALARKFVATLPATIRKLAEVRPEQIGQFLDDETARTSPDKPLARRRNLRIRLARFINWGAKKYDYPSQMRNVEGVKRLAQRRERGEIRWHELDELQAVIKAQESPYWKALIGTLGFAGLQLAEMCWLRRTDLHIGDGRGQIWVGPVTDPTNGDTHALKTGNRERHVDIHPKLLLPLLQAHLATLPADAVYVFPMPAEARRRKRKGQAPNTRRWIPSVLSTVLRGHKGGKDQKKRPAVAGKLPAGMTAATLRHTFGSLLLRSKTPKSYAEVAAAMGNSAEVVAEHYARLKGGEVRVDF